MVCSRFSIIVVQVGDNCPVSEEVHLELQEVKDIYKEYSTVAKLSYVSYY
jgi:hypothetical protein